MPRTTGATNRPETMGEYPSRVFDGIDTNIFSPAFTGVDNNAALTMQQQPAIQTEPSNTGQPAITRPGNMKWGNYAPNMAELGTQFAQTEAVTGKEMSSGVKSAFLETGLEVGSKAAIEAFNRRQAQNQKKEELALARESLSIQREALDAQKEALNQDDDSVICTELNAQGRIPADLLIAERAYGMHCVLTMEMLGYQELARPIVRMMKKSEMFTSLVHFLVRPALNEMASRVCPQYSDSIIGHIMLRTGKFIARMYFYHIMCRRRATA